MTEKIFKSLCDPVRLSDVVLVGRQAVHERLYQIVSGEVEDQTERDGDGKSRQGLLENGQQEESQTQSL